MLIALGGLILLLILANAIAGELGLTILLSIGIGIGLLATLFALGMGLGAMATGANNEDKAANAKRQTDMMRLRILAQGFAVLCGVLLMMMGRS